MGKIAVIFPGQGSQSIGMGKDFYENYEMVREYYDRANEVLGYDIKKIIFEGTQEILAQTEYTQPAVFLTSYVIFELLKNKFDKIYENIKFVAGHSLGEYTAVCTAGCISFEETLLLVDKRAKIMSEIAKKHPGGMLAVIGEVNIDELQNLCAEIKSQGFIVEPVNFNTAQQVVVAGELQGLDKLQELLANKKLKVIKLNVTGAFHSSLMDEAQKIFSETLDRTNINNALIPIVMNYDAKPHTDKEEIRQNLKLQVNHPVLWKDIVSCMYTNGIKIFIECGPGKVLSGLVKKIVPEAKVYNVDTMINFKTTIDNLRQFF